MTDRHRGGPRSRAPQPAVSPSALDLLPRWEGAPGFYAVARALQELIEMPAIGRTAEGCDIVSGADLTAFQAIVAMYKAHPVHVGPRQLEVLPAWSTASEWESAATALRYAAAMKLPFDPLFLDFTSHAGEPAWVGEPERNWGLYGALLFRAVDDVRGAMVGGGELAIVPYGVVERVGNAERCPWALPGRVRMPLQSPGGTLIVGGPRAPQGGEVWLGESGYSGSLGRQPSERMLAVAAAVPAELVMREHQSPTERTFQIPARVYAGTGGNVEPLIGAFTTGDVGRVALDTLTERWGADVNALLAESRLVLSLALEALRAMFLLDSTNVELAPAPVTRQVRRAAERSNGQTQIALTVRVQLRRTAGRSRTSSGKRDYAYAFERIGHYRHVTRGPHATEEHLRPCPRDDQPHRATGGRCRREWVPPHVVGAADGRPLVPKARLADREPPPARPEAD